jgi:hypothetical protein
MGSPLSSKVLCISAVTLCGTYSYFCGQCVEFSKYRGGVYVAQSREAWEKVNIFPQKYCAAVPAIHRYTSENWTYCVFLFPSI